MCFAFKIFIATAVKTTVKLYNDMNICLIWFLVSILGTIAGCDVGYKLDIWVFLDGTSYFQDKTTLECNC